MKKLKIDEMVAIVRRAAKKLNKKSWTRGNLAKNEFGTPVCYSDKDARKFCADGAIRRSLFDLGYIGRTKAKPTNDEPSTKKEQTFMRQLASFLGYDSYTNIWVDNDTQGLEDGPTSLRKRFLRHAAVGAKLVKKAA